MHAAQTTAITYPNQPPEYSPSAPPAFGHAYPPQQAPGMGLYPSLESYMGLELTPEMIQEMTPAAEQVISCLCLIWSLFVLNH